MTSLHRWLLVAAAVIVLIGVPLSIRALPPPRSDVSAATLARQIQASANTPYSGYAESLGTLSLPVFEQFDEIGSLFGERTQMRAWWSNPEQWRVDQVEVAGETDMIRDSRGITTWAYEAGTINRYPEAGARLPRSADLLPPTLARLLLTDVDLADVSRLPVEHIAGEDVPGLRITPSEPQTSIDHVDVWADSSNGVALRVEVYASGADAAALTSTFLDYSPEAPTLTDVTFEPPPGVRVHHPQFVDFADAANQFAQHPPPPALAGLERQDSPGITGVGLYGTGLTQITAVALPADIGGDLRQQLAGTPTVHRLGAGLSLSVGPLGMLLTKPSTGGETWLIAGTVTEAALADAESDVRDYESARVQLTPEGIS